MRVALIHYWLVNWRGGEKVLGSIAELFPEADIYTHVADPALLGSYLKGHKVFTSAISKMPLARKYYQRYLPLMPLALEQLDLRNYDLVISSESGPAKGVITGPDTIHVCYCHSPMRYVWDMYHDYRVHAGRFTKLFMTPAMHYVRSWDQLSAGRVDRFVANSRFVARRITKYYRRDSEVIHPPVAVEDFAPATSSEDFYLSVGQLVPYKRADLLVDAFNQSGQPLVIIGTGALAKVLKARAKANIRFLDWQPSDVVKDHYARCKALVFPGVEDFGIVPVEAMACGKPVICMAHGGVLETVIDGVTGVYFGEQSVSSLLGAIEQFEKAQSAFLPEVIRARSLHFSESNFKSRFWEFIQRLVSDGASARVRY